jgi:hypothetical protein
VTTVGNVFTIDVFKLVSPNGGEALTSGSSTTIDYDIYGLSTVASATFYYTLNNGSSWVQIGTDKTPADLTAGSHSYTWTTVPTVTTANPNCKVKVVLKNSSGSTIGTDMSDAVFTINP